MEELNFDTGIGDMYCECSTNKYCYEPAGHAVTGDLTIIRDADLRSLIEKGPSYQEQNCINWKINEKICKDAVAECKRKWSLREGVDVRAFNEWEHMVNYCIKRRITFLRGKYINKRNNMSSNPARASK